MSTDNNLTDERDKTVPNKQHNTNTREHRIDVKYTRHHYTKLSSIPRDGVWSTAAMPFHPGFIHSAANRGAIKQVATLAPEDLSSTVLGQDTTIWTLTEAAATALEDYEQGPSKMAMPCGHRGFQNIGDFLQCKQCDGRFTKEEVKAYDPEGDI